MDNIKNSPFTREELRFLKELVKSKVEFMIVGLSAAMLHGAPVVTQDIDLWFKNLADPKLQKALKKVGGIYIPPLGLNPPMFAGEGIRLFDIVMTMHGLADFDQEKKNTTQFSLGNFKVPALNLDRIIKSKKAADRKKDQLTIPVLEDALKLILAAGKKQF